MIIRRSILLVLVLLCAGQVCGSTAFAGEKAIYRFWVLRYQPPVQPGAWVADPALAADPEGAALNILDAMQRGDVEKWISYWDHTERPKPSRKQREALLRQWESFRGCRAEVLGRIVAGTAIIVELSLISPDERRTKLQIPMVKSNGRWGQIRMDPKSEFLHWESSNNKLMETLDPDAFRKRIEAVQPQEPSR
jgi:hypothetical protein